MNNQVLLLFCINLFSAMGYSIIAPLYPILGDQYEISEQLIGIIISTYALFNFITTPLVPMITASIGRIPAFYLATLLEGCCTLLYGLLVYIHNYSVLVGLSLLLRILHGIGSGLNGTLVYSLTATVSAPHELKTSLGYLEVAWSLGVSVGPLIASVFYHCGGYSLPFYVLGCSLFISVYLIHYLRLPSAPPNDNSPSFIRALFDVNIIITLFPVILYLLSNTFYFPSLTNHLMVKWGLSVESASLFFVFNMVVYFIGLQFLDKFTNLFGMSFTIWVGVVFIFIGPLFVYPMEFLPQVLVSIVFGLSLLGLSGAAINVPCLMQLNQYVLQRNPDTDENSVNDISSAIYNFGVNLGDFFGPVAGGVVSEKYGFKYSCLFMGLVGLAYSVVYGVYYYRDVCKGCVKNKGSEGMMKLVDAQEERCEDRKCQCEIELDLYKRY